MGRRVVLLAVVAWAVGAASPRPAAALVDLRRVTLAAAHAVGLPPQRVPTAVVPRARLDALALRRLAGEYPEANRRADAQLYAQLGLAGSLTAELARQSRGRRALYDAATRRLYVRADVSRREATAEAVRALVLRPYGLRRADDRDGMAAAEGASPEPRRSPRVRRCRPRRLRRRSGASSRSSVRSQIAGGRKLASQLRFYGGRRAARRAFSQPPFTTAQLFHFDLFLEHRTAAGLDRLPDETGGAVLTATRTFGELDVRALLATFAVAKPTDVSSGWSAGLSGLYRLPDATRAAVVALVWEDDADATAAFAAIRSYVAAAFPTAQPLPNVDKRHAGARSAGDSRSSSGAT